MRPALDRLLSRPFSLDLLRYLTTTPESPWTVPKHRRACKRRLTHRRLYAACSAVPYNVEDEDSSPAMESPITDIKLPDPQPAGESVLPKICDQEAISLEDVHGEGLQIRRPLTDSVKTWEKPFFFKRVLHGKESVREWTFDEIHYESALDQPAHPKRKRLVDQAAHKDNLELWAQLLSHRRRIFGIEGIRVIWDKMKGKKIQIPSDGHLGTLFWNSFIDLGLRKRNVLHEIVCYTEENEQGSQRLPTLYVRILQHFALQGNQSEVTFWHLRLISNHPPSAQKFRQMVRTIVYAKGDMNILQYIYEASEHRNAYANVVPILCAQGRFEEALKWHHILISHRDLPRDVKAVEILQSYLENYYPRKALEFLQSLSDAGVSFVDPDPTQLILSREAMNRFHGETHGIKEKSYNDKLGARWFATTWISLDLAVNSVHALGFREIGPLSLQSIAIREREASKITERIAQLRELGISIGNSKYAQAIETFARKNQHSLLESLLQSDQHPDALEDWELQESLLGRYAAAGEWRAYARTVAIRLLGSTLSKTQEYNILVRDHLSRPTPDLERILHVLEEMRIRGLSVKPTTCRYLINKLLRPRRKSRHPIVLLKDPKDIEILLSILHNMLKSGSYVPESVWIEVFKRLGMSGRFTQLETLCLSLADWYHPQSTTRQQNIFPHCRHSLDLRRFAIPADIKPSHRKHPFSLLFPPSVQRAIVEWGFISYFRRFSTQLQTDEEATVSYSTMPKPTTNYPIGKHPCTHGIRILHLLRNQGVIVRMKAIRMAIINRLVEYYSQGLSKRWHNRIARNLNPFTFHEFLEEVEAAWGGVGSGQKPIFSKKETWDLKSRIHSIGRTRTGRVQRKVERVRERARAKERERRKKLMVFNGGEIVYFTP